MTDLETLRYPVGRFERLTAPLDARRAPRTHRDDRADARAHSARSSAGCRTRSSTRRIVPAAGPSGRSSTTCPTAT